MLSNNISSRKGLNGIVLVLRLRGLWFEPQCIHCVVSLSPLLNNGYHIHGKPFGFEPHWRHCIVVLEQDTFILA